MSILGIPTQSTTIVSSFMPLFYVSTGSGHYYSSTTTSNTATLVQLNTKIQDFATNFNTTTYTFTAPNAGYYYFTVYPSTISSTNSFNFSTGIQLVTNTNTYILLNNYESSIGSTITGTNSGCSASALIYMNAADTLKLYFSSQIISGSGTATIALSLMGKFLY